MTGLGGANPVRFFEVGVTSSTWLTLAWNRQAIHNGTTPPASTFLANLDLRLYSRDIGSLRSQSVSAIDNVEQVSSGVAESKVAVVEAGSDYSGSETFALAHNVAITERQGPRPAVTPTAVPAVAPNATFVVTAMWTNIGDLPAHLPQLSIALPSGYTLVSGPVTKAIGGSLQPGAGTQVSWTVRAPTVYAATTATLTFYGDTTSFGWVFSGQGSTQLTMIQPPVDGDGDGLPDNWETLFGLNPGSNSGPNGASGDPDGDGRTNVQEYVDGTHPRGFVTRFLAEGSTGSFFDTRLAIMAPDTSAKLMIRYLKDDGTIILTAGDLAAGTRLTVDPEADRRPGKCDVLDGRRIGCSRRGGPDHDLGRDRVRQPRRDRADVRVNDLVSRRRLHVGQLHTCSICCRTRTTRRRRSRSPYLLPSGRRRSVQSYTLRPSSRTNIYVDETGRRPDKHRRLGGHHVDHADHRRAGDVHRQTRPAVCGGPRECGRHRSGAAMVSRRGRDRAVLRHVRPDREPESGARRGHCRLPSPGWREADQAVHRGRQRVATRSGWTTRSCRRVRQSATGERRAVHEADRPQDPSRSSSSVRCGGRVRSSGRTSGTKRTTRRVRPRQGRGGHSRMARSAVPAVRTYVLIANTSAFAGTASVRLLFEDGTSAVRSYTLPAASRTNVAVGPDFPSAANRRFATIVESIGATAGADRGRACDVLEHSGRCLGCRQQRPGHAAAVAWPAQQAVVDG